MNNRLVPIILAAGASSRMGSPKALLDLRGRLAVDRILDTCVRAGLGRPVVVLGSEADAIAAAADLSRAEVVRNEGWKSGMTSSVKVGLNAVPPAAEGAFLWPVDLPLVPAQVLGDLGLRFWIARQNRRNPIVIPKADRRGHPVLFDRKWFVELRALGDGELPRAVIARHETETDEITAGPETTHDLDTPGELAAALNTLPPD